MRSDASGGARLLVVSGSTRRRSTNTALCLTAAAWPPDGVAVQCFADLAALPHFNPDDDVDALPEPVVGLRAEIAAADAVLFCTPEYAGTLPGAMKNLLDWTIGGTELSDKPVAWVNVAVDPQRGHGAHAALATVLGYVQARVVNAACRHVPVPRDAVGPDGVVTDTSIHDQIGRAIHS